VGRLLQPIQDVRGGRARTGETRDERLRSPDPRAAVLREEPLVEAEGRSDGPPQTRDLSGPEAQDRGEEVPQRLALWRFT
jgi:hypothetical protein